LDPAPTWAEAPQDRDHRQLQVPPDDRGDLARRHALVSDPVSVEEAGDHFGWLGAFFGADVPASSALTRELLGWIAVHPGLIADPDEGHYFRQAQPAAA
jgi:hypothetical protein